MRFISSAPATLQMRWRKGAATVGLWPRMALGTSFGFVVLFVAFSLLGERALHDSAEHILDERLVIAQMAASQLDRQLSQAISALEQARHLADFDPTLPDHAGELQILARTYDRVDLFAPGIAFWDAAGRLVLSYPPEHYPVGANSSLFPYVAQALTHRTPLISDPFRDPLSGRPVAAVTIPISADGRFLGVLSGLIDLGGPAITGPLEEAARLGQTGHALLVDREGRTLIATFPLPFLAPGEHPTFYRQVLRRGESQVARVPTEIDEDGSHAHHTHAMAVAPLQTVTWGVATGADEDETFVGVSRLRYGLALLGVAALAGVWSVTLIATRRLVSPVHHLTSAAQRIADGDLQTPLEVVEGGEIGAMAAALDRMRQQLLMNIAELANLNETLESRVTERTEALQQQQALTQRLLHKVITAQEEERGRLSRELHDEIGQTLTAVQLSLGRFDKILPAADAGAHERLNRARTLTEQALTDLRHVIAALRPGVLDQLGLAPALSWVADHTLRPLGVHVIIDTNGLEGRLPGEIETILFRIAQEAMNNVARHSEADTLTIRLARADSQILMTLQDNGRGFDPRTVITSPDLSHGLGLAGMQERASLAGGQVRVESAPGQGTMIHVLVPVPAGTEVTA